MKAILLGTLLWCAQGFASGPILQKVEANGGGDSDFVTEMTFDSKVEAQGMIEYAKEYIQIDIKGPQQLTRREVLRVANKDITSVILTQFSPETVRARFMLKEPGSAEKFKGRIAIENQGSNIRLRIMADGAMAAALDEEPTESTENSQTSLLDQPAAELLAGEMTNSEPIHPTPTSADSEATPIAAVPASIATPTAPKAESEIPVLTKLSAPSSQGKSLWGRLVASLVVILLVAGGMVLFSKQWAKRRTGLSQHHQIKVLTQYGLGPKKSLAIVRVAGESILIGITDQNISMLKSLSLLDEDLPLDVPKSFPEELQQTLPTMDRVSITGAVAKVETKDNEDFSFGTVRDMVASRLREMRSL